MNEGKIHILLLEDDETLGYLLSEYLKLKQFEVTWCKQVSSAREKLNHLKFQLAILDVMLPDRDGFSFAEEISKTSPELSFLFLTARSLKTDVLKGFSIGAVDYIKKPIDEEELVARIHAILRRNSSQHQLSEETIHKIGLYKFEPSKQELSINGEIKSLTARESDILSMLVSNANELTSYEDIMNNIWGEDDYFSRKSLNVYISNLRKYLRKDLNMKIDNVHRKGFILKIRNR
ncbi:response regulator transcription factor [Aegicerativicinus sediminis]|uniref:response regulator transcription factor n=1 Tax=Aegicerativicinus sediminis TaxID=2893202 RepID=UPI001E350012|nr:response regulator transcription factor [Aegicerativicinus sediminis]